MMTVATKRPRLATLIERHYGELHPGILRHLLQWTLLLREAFDGDLDSMIVLAVIGDRLVTDPKFPNMGYSELMNRPQFLPDLPQTNRRSIADSTGIPRETVRRKVAALVARGWIEERSDGSLIVTGTAAQALHPTTLRSFEILGNLGEALNAARTLDG
jgi:hypothetical protein